MKGEERVKEIASTVTSKGQVTIPVEVRKHLGIQQGDKVSFIIDEVEGSVRLESPRYRSVADLRGAAGCLKEPLAWSEVLTIAREDQAHKAVDTP